jgi:hypothetical protein
VFITGDFRGALRASIFGGKTMKYLAIIALFLLAGFVIAPAYGQKDTAKSAPGTAMQCKDGGKDGGMMGHEVACKDGGMMGHDGGCCKDGGMMYGRGGMNGCPAHGMMMNGGMAPRGCGIARMVVRCIFGLLFFIALLFLILMQWHWLQLLMIKLKAAKHAQKQTTA